MLLFFISRENTFNLILFAVTLCFEWAPEKDCLNGQLAHVIQFSLCLNDSNKKS